MKHQHHLLAAVAALAVSVSVTPAPPSNLLVLTTNEFGAVAYVVRTNAPAGATNWALPSAFLSPEAAARVYTSMLDAHMEAVRRGWVEADTAAGQYRWLEDRLLLVCLHTPMSDWERELARAQERQLRSRIADLEQQLRVAAEEAKARAAEIAALNDRLRDRNPPKK